MLLCRITIKARATKKKNAENTGETGVYRPIVEILNDFSAQMMIAAAVCRGVSLI